MKTLFWCANEYLRQADWRDLALLKSCRGAAGMAAGICLPKRLRTPALAAAVAVFLLTYLLLMGDFISVCARAAGRSTDKTA